MQHPFCLRSVVMARALFESRKPLFWEQVRIGLLAGEAGVAVGVSATCGRRWFREAGGVKPRLGQPSTAGPRRRLSLEERVEIQAGIHAEESLRSIGRRLGRHASTIKREIDNNCELRNRFTGRTSGYRRKHAFGAHQSGGSARVQYRAMAAHDRGADRARRPKLRNLAKNDTLRHEVQSRLELRHSPAQIAKRLRIDFPETPEMWVSYEAIYQAIYVQGGGRCAGNCTSACGLGVPFAGLSISPERGGAASRTWSISVNAQLK
jgi:hypothetical protein